MSNAAANPKTAKLSWRSIGPGIMVAATGVGAGDVIAAAIAGANYGHAILWAAVVGAVLKFTLNEGLARWQLATGETLLEGWMTRLPKVITWYFLLYLVLWSLFVGAALIAACGLAGHALMPQLSVPMWGLIHTLAAMVLVLTGRYAVMEAVMKWFIALMFLTVMICAAALAPPIGEVLSGLLIVSVPEGSVAWIMGVIGGVGGTVTVLSYGYWIREKGMQGSEHLPTVKLDLGVGYLLTGGFGIAVMVITAGLDVAAVSGNTMALVVAESLGEVLGSFGKWAFLIGFWAAVFSSMIGVWQGVPYIFADYMRLRGQEREAPVDQTRTRAYRGFLVYLGLAPLLLMQYKPAELVKFYAVVGAAFMPFLALLILFMNNKIAWVAALRNDWKRNLVLGLALALFAFLMITKLMRELGLA